MPWYGLKFTNPEPHQIDEPWVVACDDAGDPIVAYATHEAALIGAKAHKELYDIDCEPSLLAD